jgi:DnaJ-class molecular chaperone
MSITCPDCQGQGTFTITVMNGMGTVADEEKECPTCHGKGEIDDPNSNSSGKKG